MNRIREILFDALFIVGFMALLIVLSLMFGLNAARGADVYRNFALQPGDGRTISEQQLRLAGVDGLTVRVRPAQLSVNGRWDYSFPDASFARCRRTGDVATLLLMGGANNPLSETNLKFYEASAVALGARYASDPILAGVH